MIKNKIYMHCESHLTCLPLCHRISEVFTYANFKWLVSVSQDWSTMIVLVSRTTYVTILRHVLNKLHMSKKYIILHIRDFFMLYCNKCFQICYFFLLLLGDSWDILFCGSCQILLLLLLLLFLSLKKVDNSRLGVTNLHPISPKIPAPKYQPIQWKKRKGKHSNKKRERAAKAMQ